ncbi:hypothetical protein WAI453_007293 [Rhynchosporium graminicola]
MGRLSKNFTAGYSRRQMHSVRQEDTREEFCGVWYISVHDIENCDWARWQLFQLCFLLCIVRSEVKTRVDTQRVPRYQDCIQLFLTVPRLRTSGRQNVKRGLIVNSIRFSKRNFLLRISFHCLGRLV